MRRIALITLSSLALSALVMVGGTSAAPGAKSAHAVSVQTEFSADAQWATVDTTGCVRQFVNVSGFISFRKEGGVTVQRSCTTTSECSRRTSAPTSCSTWRQTTSTTRPY